MAQQQGIRLTPTQIAQEAKPGWRAASGVFGVDSAEKSVKPDAVLPEVNDLMSKYFGTPKADPSPDIEADSSADEGLVPMEPENAQDVRAGRKVTYVSGGEVRGDQG